MKIAYENENVTLWHGEDSCCASVFSVVQCHHENINHVGRGAGVDANAAASSAETRRSCSRNPAPERLHVDARTAGKGGAMGGRSSGMEGRQGERQGWAVAGLAFVPTSAVFGLREGTGGTAPHRRQHPEQQTRQHPVCLPQVSHGKGRAA